MADTVETPAIEGTGQAAAAPEGTTAPAPATVENGQGGDTTTSAAPAQGQAKEESFFDPATVPESLKPAYKQMQAAFTKKMQATSDQLRAAQHKISAYDQFERDPAGTIQQLASQMGYRLSRAEAQAVADQQQPQQDWQPASWEEVLGRAEERAEKRLMGKLAPVLQTVERQHAQSIESALDDIDPSWRDHEDAMRENLRKMPALAGDIRSLYKLSVPDDVLMSRATQRVLKQLEGKTKSAAVGGGNKRQAAPVARAVNSFDDAVAAAREQLARGG